jgi:hypothetical protein
MTFRHARENTIAFAILALAAGLAIAAPSYFTRDNLGDLFLANLPVLIVALGMTLVILTGEIDISVGSVFAVCGIVAGTVAKWDLPMAMVWLVACGAGAIFGLANGALVGYVRIPSIVVTLAMMIASRATLRWVTQGAWVQDLYDAATGEVVRQIPAARPATTANTLNAGSFEDYVLRYAKEKGKAPEQISTQEIELLRKKFGQADDRLMAVRDALAPPEFVPQARIGLERQELLAPRLPLPGVDEGHSQVAAHGDEIGVQLEGLAKGFDRVVELPLALLACSEGQGCGLLRVGLSQPLVEVGVLVVLADGLLDLFDGQLDAAFAQVGDPSGESRLRVTRRLLGAGHGRLNEGRQEDHRKERSSRHGS